MNPDLIASREHNALLKKEIERLRAALAAEKERAEKAENGVGWLYHNPDTGVEFDTDHPVRSGKVDDATNIRRATADELLSELKMAWEVIEEERSAAANQGSKWIDACRDRDAAIARAEAADLALQKISLLLGGTDEWSSQENMIADVCRQAEDAIARAEAGEALLREAFAVMVYRIEQFDQDAGTLGYEPDEIEDELNEDREITSRIEAHLARAAGGEG